MAGPNTHCYVNLGKSAETVYVESSVRVSVVSSACANETALTCDTAVTPESEEASCAIMLSALNSTGTFVCAMLCKECTGGNLRRDVETPNSIELTFVIGSSNTANLIEVVDLPIVIEDDFGRPVTVIFGRSTGVSVTKNIPAALFNESEFDFNNTITSLDHFLSTVLEYSTNQPSPSTSLSPSTSNSIGTSTTLIAPPPAPTPDGDVLEVPEGTIQNTITSTSKTTTSKTSTTSKSSRSSTTSTTMTTIAPISTFTLPPFGAVATFVVSGDYLVMRAKKQFYADGFKLMMCVYGTRPDTGMKYSATVDGCNNVRVTVLSIGPHLDPDNNFGADRRDRIRRDSEEPLQIVDIDFFAETGGDRNWEVSDSASIYAAAGAAPTSFFKDVLGLDFVSFAQSVRDTTTNGITARTTASTAAPPSTTDVPTTTIESTTTPSDLDGIIPVTDDDSSDDSSDDGKTDSVAVNLSAGGPISAQVGVGIGIACLFILALAVHRLWLKPWLRSAIHTLLCNFCNPGAFLNGKGKGDEDSLLDLDSDDRLAVPRPRTSMTSLSSRGNPFQSASGRGSFDSHIALTPSPLPRKKMLSFSEVSTDWRTPERPETRVDPFNSLMATGKAPIVTPRSQRPLRGSLVKPPQQEPLAEEPTKKSMAQQRRSPVRLVLKQDRAHAGAAHSLEKKSEEVPPKYSEQESPPRNSPVPFPSLEGSPGGSPKSSPVRQGKTFDSLSGMPVKSLTDGFEVRRSLKKKESRPGRKSIFPESTIKPPRNDPFDSAKNGHPDSQRNDWAHPVRPNVAVDPFATPAAPQSEGVAGVAPRRESLQGRLEPVKFAHTPAPATLLAPRRRSSNELHVDASAEVGGGNKASLGNQSPETAGYDSPDEDTFYTPAQTPQRQSLSTWQIAEAKEVRSPPILAELTERLSSAKPPKSAKGSKAKSKLWGAGLKSSLARLTKQKISESPDKLAALIRAKSAQDAAKQEKAAERSKDAAAEAKKQRRAIDEKQTVLKQKSKKKVKTVYTASNPLASPSPFKSLKQTLLGASPTKSASKTKSASSPFKSPMKKLSGASPMPTRPPTTASAKSTERALASPWDNQMKAGKDSATAATDTTASWKKTVKQKAAVYGTSAEATAKKKKAAAIKRAQVHKEKLQISPKKK